MCKKNMSSKLLSDKHTGSDKQKEMYILLNGTYIWRNICFNCQLSVIYSNAQSASVFKT